MRPGKRNPAGCNLRDSGKGAGEQQFQTQDTAEGMAALLLAQIATDAARTQLDRYALATDWPALGIVEAADLLDAARAALAGAP